MARATYVTVPLDEILLPGFGLLVVNGKVDGHVTRSGEFYADDVVMGEIGTEWSGHVYGDNSVDWGPRPGGLSRDDWDILVRRANLIWTLIFPAVEFMALANDDVREMLREVAVAEIAEQKLELWERM